MTSLLVLSAILVAFHTFLVLLDVYENSDSNSIPMDMTIGYPFSSAIFIIVLWHFTVPLSIILLSVLLALNIIRAGRLLRTLKDAEEEEDYESN